MTEENRADDYRVDGDGRTASATLRRQVHQIASGGSFAVVGKLSGRAAAFGLNLLLGNVLGPRSYGLYALSNSVFSLANRLATVGLDKGAIRFGSLPADADEEFTELVYAVLLLSLGSGVAFGVGLYLASGRLSRAVFRTPELAPILEIFAFLVPFLVFLRMVGALFQSRRRIDYQQLVLNVIRPVLTFAFVAAAFFLGAELRGAVLGILFAGIVSSLAGGYLFLRTHPGVHHPVLPSSRIVREQLAFALPMMLVSLSYFLLIQTDRLMLGILASPRDVGVYNVAAIVSMQLTIVHGSLITIFFPIISNLQSRGEQAQLRSLYNTVKRWAIYGSVLLLLPVLFFPRTVMGLFGPEFRTAWLVLPLLSIGQVAGAAFGPTGALLQMSGRERLEAVNSGLLAAGNVVLNFILIPVFGVFGAVMATVFTQVGLNLLQTYQIFRYNGIQPLTRRHLLFLAGVAVISLLGIASNIYFDAVVRASLFVFVAALVSAVGYLGHTAGDREALAAILETVAGRVDG